MLAIIAIAAIAIVGLALVIAVACGDDTPQEHVETRTVGRVTIRTRYMQY